MPPKRQQTKSPGKVTGQHIYLTKRILVRAARAAGRKAAVKAMKVMGYTVVASRGWIVKKYPDGRTEQMERIDTIQK